MKINQSNYEIFFLDYLDGKLSDTQVDEFLDFLKANPELKKELKSISEIKLPSDDVAFQWKSDLIKGEQENNSFDYRAIAFMDGDLSEEDQKAFVEELDSDSKNEHEFDLILSTKLKKDNTQYPDKEKLYRKSKVRMLYWVSRVAAVVVLLMAIWAIYQREQVTVQKPILSESLTPALKSDKNKFEQKQEPITKKKAVEKVEEAKTDSIPKKTKSIREKTKGRLKEVVQNKQVSRIAAPEKIISISATFESKFNDQQYALETMKPKAIPKQPEYISIDKFLAQKIFKRNKKNSGENIAQKGLKAVSSWSNEKLAYETDNQGKVSEISLNTNLLAFTIPVSKK